MGGRGTGSGFRAGGSNPAVTAAAASAPTAAASAPTAAASAPTALTSGSAGTPSAARATTTARLTTSQKDNYVRQLTPLVSRQLFRSDSRAQRQIDRIEQEIRDTYGDTALQDVQSEVRRAMRSMF